MNFFGNRSASSGTANTAKKPIIKRTTVQVAAPKQQTVRPVSTTGNTARPPPAARKPASKPAPVSTSAAQAPAPGDRFQLSASSRKRAKPSAARRAISDSRGVKRKSATPQPVLSSDDESDSETPGLSDSDASRKRFKSSVSSVASSVGPRRQLALSSKAQAQEQSFVHGADLTSKEDAHKYKNPWDQEAFATCELQYPSRNPRERFELKWPKNEADDYKPMEDIIETCKLVARAYFPEELADKILHEETGLERRFNRAWQRQDVAEFVKIVEQYNDTLGSLVKDGTIEKHLERQGSLHLDAAHDLDWITRILDQVYARTVSPKVETLKAYKNGSDNVYGELLPRFVSKIFQQTKLNHEQVFIDLGSGVGNVVMQAALEVGCESYGIEMMDNPCKLAELQAREFPSRARLWGLKVGKVELLKGDFTDSPRIGKLLKNADVVLVNNQAFTPALNDKLVNMFLDLKEGAQVVSLKPFGFLNEWDKVDARNEFSVCNLFVQKEYEYFSGSVSWTDRSGSYFIAKKDSKPMEEYSKRNQRASRY